jgi:hypothetical protein
MEIIVALTYDAIFTLLTNVQYLDLFGNDDNPFSEQLLRGLSATRCYSSSIAHLCIKIHNFDDCLCLLDGRLSQLHTLIVKLDYIRNSSILINNEVKNIHQSFAFAVLVYVAFSILRIIQKEKVS